MFWIDILSIRRVSGVGAAAMAVGGQGGITYCFATYLVILKLLKRG
jgi:hypothetical protein